MNGGNVTTWINEKMTSRNSVFMAEIGGAAVW